ncbi:glycosyltransferase [Lysobacter sp. F60174L2]|uniref:glycosyltransferase n=1 Tax=Lysobacter sp. F60174L2 TaxID=3459295 RepID=UPI00403E1A8A
MKQKALLILATSFPMEVDGREAAGAFVADFAEAMSHHMPVRVVAPGRRAGREKIGNIEVWRFSSGSKPLSLLSPMRPWHWIAILSALRSLRRQAFAASADGMVLHTFALWVLPSGWVAKQLQRKHAIPYSVWALGSDIWSLGRLPVLNGFLRRVCESASEVYADGVGLAAEAGSLCGRDFSFLPSCRRLDGIRSKPAATTAPYRLLFLGRWHPNKGVDLLLEALNLLEDADWHRIAEVHIAGGGPMEELVRAQVARLNSAARPVQISGYLGRSEASAALARADRLLLPSRIESIPVIFSDALAYRIPIIAMPVGDLPGLLEHGVVARSVTAAHFAEAIRRGCTPENEAARESMERLANIFNVEKSAARVFLDVSNRSRK